MRSRAVASAIVVAVGCTGLAWPLAASAQAPPSTPTPPPSADSSGPGVHVAADLGPRTFSQPITAQQRAKFLDYRDVPSKALVQALVLDYTPADNYRRFELGANDVGLLDQTIVAHAKQPGLFDVSLRWDRIPHTFSTDGRSLLTETSRGVYTLPTPRPDTAAFNRAPFIDPIRSMWDPVKLAVGVTPSKQWDFRAEYTRIGKSGDRPMGQAFGGSGNNASEILEPIDQTIHDLKLSQSYAQERFQFVATYDLSIFHNGIKSVTSDNPLNATDTPAAGAARGRTALAPDNLANTVVANGGLNLGFHTRVTGSAAMSWWRQNDAFVPVTTNTLIVDPRIAQIPTSLGGSATTANFAGAVTSRPTSYLTFSARYRSYDFHDRATTSILPIIVLNDRSVSPADTARRDPFTRRNADVSGTWRVLEPLSLTAGYAWEQMSRDSLTRNVARTNEGTPRASLDFTGIDWLTLRSSYSKGWRRGGTYSQVATTENADSRRYDEADRNRERTALMASVTPIGPVTVSGTWEVGHDLYPHSAYGVQSDFSTSVGGDVSFSLTDWLTAGAGVMRDTFDDLMRARYRTGTQLTNLTYDWVGSNTDVVTTTSVDVTATLIPNRIELGGSYQLSHARYAMATSNPTTPTGGTAAQNTSATAFNLPEVSQSLQPIDTYVRYQFRPDWAVTLRYHGELYSQNDYKTLGLAPARATSANGLYVFLANNFQNYDARYFTISFTYHPRLIRLGRSTI
jgi:MtrB/PioB family decaheme-associated outer membrane protein